jgi:CheY-like chemotaxis protein
MSQFADSFPNCAVPPTVLLVDDNPMVRETVAMILEEREFQVVVARDGHAGLAAVEHAQPDVVLTDIIMPELDGIGFLAALRRSHPTIKIVVMSGGGRVGNSDYLSIAAKLGADGILAKPFTDDELDAVLKDVLTRPAPVAGARVA